MTTVQGTLTNDLLYESNDSREIEKGSISDSLSRVAVDVPEGFDRRGQKPFFSGGDGFPGVSSYRPVLRLRLTGRYTPLSLTTVFESQSAILSCISEFSIHRKCSAHTTHFVLDWLRTFVAADAQGR